MMDHPVPGSSSNKDGKQNKAGDKHLKSIASIRSAWKTPMFGNAGGPVDSGSLFGSSKATHSLKLKSNAKIDEDYSPTSSINRKKKDFVTEGDSTTSITTGSVKVKEAASSSSIKSNTKIDPLICEHPLLQFPNPPAIKVNSQSYVDLTTYRPVVEDPMFLSEGGDGNHIFKFTGFDTAEIKALSKRFRKLDKNSDGMITQEEFMSTPDLQSNPIVSRVIDIFDTDKTGSVNFREFVHGMSLFSENSKKERIGILRFAFRIYDMDNDGYISNGELFQVLKLMVGDNLTDIELQQIVDKTIIYGDIDKDNKISFQEFVNATGGFGYEQKMVLMNL